MCVLKCRKCLCAPLVRAIRLEAVSRVLCTTGTLNSPSSFVQPSPLIANQYREYKCRSEFVDEPRQRTQCDSLKSVIQYSMHIHADLPQQALDNHNVSYCSDDIGRTTHGFSGHCPIGTLMTCSITFSKPACMTLFFRGIAE